jgi:hypothetical protein
VLLLPGCGQQPAAPAPLPAPPPVSTKVCEIEVSDVKATLVKPDVVAFELKYRFTKGEPDKFYACVFAFPGTANHGERRMDSWELKTEGVIKDTVKLFKPPAKTFEVYMTESPSPMLQYKKISNTVSGPVQPGS